MFKSKDMTQASFEAPDTSRKKRKRNRDTLSCISCRDRKVACNRERPCSNCIRYKRADTCAYLSDQTRGSSSGPQDGLSATTSPEDRATFSLDQRLAHIETAVNSISEARAGGKAGINGNGSTATNGQTSQISAPPVAILSGTSDRNIFAQGRLACKQSRRATYYIAAVAWSIPGPYKCFYENEQLEQKLGGRLRRIHTELIKYRHQHPTILSSCVPDAISTASILELLPLDTECLSLSKRFMDTVNRIYPIVNPSTFNRELHRFLVDRSSVSDSWLALLAVILAIGYDLPVGPMPDSTFDSSRDKLLQLTKIAHYATCAAATKTHRPSLTTLQALIGVVVARRLHFEWLDANNSVTGLLALAQRLIFTMGLHRDSRLARKSLELEDGPIRESLFHTYLLLEYTNSLETGVPFLLRQGDFDARCPGSTPGAKECHPSDFIKAFPALATGIQFSHSGDIKPTPDKIRQTIRGLERAGDASLREATDVTVESVVDMLQSSIVPSLANRLHTALLGIMLEQGTAEYRQSLVSDMYKPALTLVDTYDRLMATAEQLNPPEKRDGVKKLIYMCMRSQIASTGGYLLLLLKNSLSDDTLLSTRRPNSTPLDSSFLFRKLRTMAEWSTCGLNWTWQVAREVGSLNAYLHAVQAQYQIYVETGVPEPDLLGQSGYSIVEAMATGLESTFERAGIISKPGSESILNPPPPVDMSNQFDPSAIFNPLDPLLFQNFDFPWADLVASGSDMSWPTPINNDYDFNQAGQAFQLS